MSQKIKIFYDGRCKLCMREIIYYRKVASSDIFEWIDINKAPHALIHKGVSLSDGLMYMHAQDESGELHIGVDAFILIWKNLNFWCMLASLISIPPLYQLSRFFYNLFARWRFNRLDHCLIAREEKNYKKHDD